MVQFDIFTRVVVAVGILIIGYVFMRFFSRIIIKLRRTAVSEKDIMKKPFTSFFEKVFFAAILVTALFFLGFTSVENFALGFVEIIPDIMIFILLIILGVVIVETINSVLKKIADYTRLGEIVSEDVNKSLVPFILLIVRVVLYIILIQVILSIVNIPMAQSLGIFITYPILFILFAAVLVSLINPMRDFSASFYLRHVFSSRAGNNVQIDSEKYIMKHISWLYSEMESEKGDKLVVPNRVLAQKEITFEKPIHELETLEEIKDHYVAQAPSMCGPASAQIALSVFGIKADQKEISKLAGSIERKTEDQVAGTHPKNLIEAVEKITDNEVTGVWLDYDKIYNLKGEINIWLREGALVIIDYKKRYLFPSAKRAHYSLVLGIRRDELLVVDPSSKKGGIYFVDYRDVVIGMDTYSELIKGKRGYIVLAKKGSTAFNRIKEGLIYYHPTMYERLTKQMATKLNKLTSTPAITGVFPDSVKKYLKRIEKEQISRVWKP